MQDLEMTWLLLNMQLDNSVAVSAPFEIPLLRGNGHLETFVCLTWGIWEWELSSPWGKVISERWTSCL